MICKKICLKSPSVTKTSSVRLTVHIIIAACLPLIALIAPYCSSAQSGPLEWTYTQSSQLVLNSDGGPWLTADLANWSLMKLSNLTIDYGASGQYPIGPMRLVHAPICLNPVGSTQGECGKTNTYATPLKPLSQDQANQIDGYLQKAEDAHLKVILRFAYNFFEGGDDAPLHVIKADIQMLAPVVARHKNIIYAMDAGFIGYWGEGHNSQHGKDDDHTNNTPHKTREFMEAEEAAFGPYVTLLNRYPSNIMDWEPRGQVIWGIHDDHYAGNPTDANTWKAPAWSRFDYTTNTLQHFGGGRSDEKPVSAELGDAESPLLSQDYLDAYSKRFHLNSMDLNWNTNNVRSESWFYDFVRHIGPAIGLTDALLDSYPVRGASSTLTLSFINTGYSRLFVNVPMYLVLTDSAGKQLSTETFRPVRVPLDLTTIAGSNGEASVSVPVTFPVDLAPGSTYKVALWMPDPDSKLNTMPEYNYLLNNKDVFNRTTMLNELFPVEIQ